MLTVLDLQRRAKSRLPKLIYDFIEGGAADEASVRRNTAIWDNIRLVPHVLSLGRQRSVATRFLGREYSAPFGVSPMGLGRLAWHDTDEGLARATGAAGLPYSLSAAGSSSIEDIARWSDGLAWFQIYLTTLARASTTLMERAQRAGIGTLVITVDANNSGRRLRDLRNGFTLPFKAGRPSVLADFALHPRWSLSTWKAGAPRMVNLESATGSKDAISVATLMQNMAAAELDWPVLAQLRERWTGKLIVKGVLHPEDARRMVSLGVDAISVSNHGGRQLGAAVSPIEMLPAVRAAVGPDYPLLLDSGLRSGEDIAKALALGANFVLLGRPFLYAAAALGGAEGGRRIVEILKTELSVSLAQLGCASVGDLDASFVHHAQSL